SEDRAVISGLGQSAIGRRLPTSRLRLTLDAISRAVADAGLQLDDIDGLATYPGPVAGGVPGFVGPDLYDVQDALGLQLDWHLAAPQGAAQVAPIFGAILAVAAGLCKHAVVFRTVTESSGQGSGPRRGIGGLGSDGQALLLAVGAVSGANWSALYAQRHMSQFGTTKEQLGWLACTQRAHAARNPDAVFQKPLTMADYLTSRSISTPLSLFDCDVPVDGATAVVISTAAARDDLRQPVRIEAIGGALHGRPPWEQRADLTTMAAHDAAKQLWSRTSLRPADVDVAQLYDGFSIFVLMWLEAYGFCEPGEAGPFVEGGTAIDLNGRLPLNTAGGQLSAGRLHGFGLIGEAIRQLRGEADDRQVQGAEVAAVGVGGGPVAGAMLLTA
ncbi:MAG: acetyl-CoA acetyltransferase, partial [Ilumatobacteraceae bacterium]|nr:acetyl-CoA acetyltransferase [Ilumatobacteraceae bacterium]